MDAGSGQDTTASFSPLENFVEQETAASFSLTSGELDWNRLQIFSLDHEGSEYN